MELDLALSYVLIRFILPLILGTAVIFRQNLFSCIYLILLLIGPILPKPSPKTVISGSVGFYVKAIIILSFLINVSHIVFQIVLFSVFPDYGQSIDYCSPIGRLYNLIGLHRYNAISVWSVLRLCGLDFLVLISAGALHVFIKDVYKHQIEVEREREELAKEQEARRLERMERRERRLTEAGLSCVSVMANTKAIQEKYKKKLRAQKASAWASFLAEFLFLIVLCSAAVLNPSLSSSFYLLLFLSISSWIACNRPLGVLYHYIRVFLTIYVALHFIMLFIYQMEYMRPHLPPEDLNARLFGFVDYVNINCTTVRQMDYKSFHWPIYVHSFVLIGLYFICATLVRRHFFTKSSFVIDSMKRVSRGSHDITSRNITARSDFIPPVITATNNTNSSVWNQCNDDHQNNLTECLSSKDNQTRDGEQTVINESLHLDEITRASNDSTPLLSDDKTGKFYNTSDRLKLSGYPKSGLEIDSRGSIIWKPEPEVSNYSSISGAIGQSASRPESPMSPMTPIGPMAAESAAHQVSPFVQLIKLVKKGSYVGTLIVMMTWSITYHSWLSFILLLWSCIIWMIPNSRQACLKSSPALVVFALILLIGQYIYSLNLTDEELPSQFGTVSMNEIGFKKYFELSYQPLFIKILYTLMFWITLRQYLEDRETEKRKRFAQGVMVQPFNIGYGTGQGGAPRQDLRRQMSLATTTGTHQSPAVQWMVDLLKDFLIKYWIWIVASMLMVMSLSGDQVVLYRVIYMALFLTFILAFQLSFSLWRRFLYVFWLIVIFYSMVILTAIYTYQFNEFPDYWNQYLKINKELQEDLGLQVYDHDAWILFKELFTPTFFLIITIIQVHFLHKSFLEFSDFEKQSSTSPTSTTSQSVTTESPTQNTGNDTNEVKLEIEIQSQSSNDTSTPNTIKSIKKKASNQSSEQNKESCSSSSFATPNQGSPTKYNKSVSVVKDNQSRPESKAEQNNDYKSSLDEIKELMEILWNKLQPKVDLIFVVIWRLLELHIIKAVLFSAVFVAIADISAMNTVFVILVVLVMPFTQFEGIICHMFGLWAGVLIIVKMIFQLQFAQQIIWTTNCTQNYNGNGSAIIEVYPFNSTVDNREYIGFKKTDNIFGYIIDYIILILILVFRTVVNIYQDLYRTKRNVKEPSPGVVFNGINRKDADKDFKQLVMFLINFCFYKFGVEICFILLTISIGSRNDLFSVLYSFWLLFLVLMNRQTIERVWPYFVGFLVIVLPLQYLLCLGIPPGLCIDYPWASLSDRLRDWLFLPDFRNPLEVNKLYLDFFILLLSCRQLIGFRLEKSETYIGGTNIEAHLDTNPMHNPKVPDFFAFGNTIFDSIKSTFFFCFFWVTLAVVFLAGTTRVSLFALGYVLGCFIFLWNGNEFYLKPIEVVFRLWKTIIAYTSAVILIKAILQIVGCVYITALYANFCWVVQLLGIACLGKSQTPSNSAPSSGTCSAPYDEAGLLWDGICFAFLIIQKRIFCSYYFNHLIREIKAQQVLASRGAELIHEIQAKEVSDQEQAEKEVMEKIKQKMDRIKAAQQKMFHDKAKSIKSHKQEDYDYDVSPYSTAEGSLSHTPETEEPLSHTLPTVYSPTPSLPTIVSPQSAMSSQPGYLEVYKVAPIRSIDAPSSSVTFPSFSFKSGSSVGEDSFPIFSPSPTPTPAPYANIGNLFTGLRVATVPIEGRSDASSLFQSSTRTQIPQRVVRETPSRVHSFKRKASTRSHGSSVRSGGYYMFDENESEIVDLNEKPRQSLIPDPEGDEMRKIAKVHGFTAFCAKLMKGEVDDTEATIVSAEATDVGESSKDSAIVSVDRERTDPDASRRTTYTTVPSTPVSSRPSSLPIERKPSKAFEKESGDLLKEEEEEEEAEAQTHRKESLFTKMKNWFSIIIQFIESALISMTAKLNSLSRDYRYVARRLSVEKRYLKRIFEIEESNGSRYDFMDNNWKKRTLAKISQSTVPKETKSIDSIDELHRKKRSKIEAIEDTKKSVLSDEALISLDTDLEDSAFLKANVYMRFFRSIFYAILSRSEFMCYIVIVLNQISSASVLSLPLPLFAFLWGSLSVPRPSKAFWITVITYTEVIVVIKYIFQFQFWPWLSSGKVDITPFYVPRIMGIERSDHYAQFDLALLLVLFYHRFMLKSLGLWDLSETEITSFMENAERRNSLSLVQTTSSAENTEKVKEEKKSDKKIKPSIEMESSSQSKALVVCETSGEIEENLEMSLLFREPDDQFSEMSPSDDIKEESSEGFNAFLTLISLSTLKKIATHSTKPFGHFFNSVLHPPYRITRDVYSLMFLCDFMNFFILVFGFYAFGSGYSSTEDVTSFLEENKIPIPFLVTLLMQFALIIIDRAIYLRKYIKGKLVFQIFLTLGMHMWLFFALPAMTDRPFTSRDNWPPKAYYIFKCIYFLLSAYQIRSGYPTRILGNTFCKKYNLINWYLFKGYMIIPFLYDLRMYMDWIWTDTSLVLDEWSLMEDIFVNLYERKCELKLDDEFPEPRGKAKRRFFKYLLGGAWVVLIIGLIWGPLGLFALGRAVGSTNKPVGATFELEFGGYQPVFRMSVTGTDLNEISEPLWDRLKNNDDYIKDAVAQTFLSGYDKGDVTLVNLNGNSTATWGISPPSQKSLEMDLRSSNISIHIKLTYYITRKKQQKTQDMDVTITSEQSIELKPKEDQTLRQQIARMLSDEEDENEAAIIPFIFPNYLRVPEKGKPSVVKYLAKKQKSGAESNDTFRYRSVGILLKKGKYENSSMTSWWEVHDPCRPQYMENLDQFFRNDLLIAQNCEYLPIVLFNDKVFIGLLAFLSGYGIIGIYTTFVFLVSRWVRGLNSESSFKVIYTRMPNVDRVLQLCLDIYLVRESREFELEEDLYAKLIFLYRSPETLIKWTKPLEELPSGAIEQHHRQPHSARIDH